VTLRGGCWILDLWDGRLLKALVKGLTKFIPHHAHDDLNRHRTIKSDDYLSVAA
jgi:hypothetical protein